MRTLISTSDKYLHLLVPYTILFNKYWPNQDVTFLGFDDSNIPELPDNFKYVSLGKQSDFEHYWTNPLIPYINAMEEEYFIISMEDVMLIDYVNLEGMELLENEIRSGNADKAVLDTHLNVYSIPYKTGMTQMKVDAPYRTTLHPSIWRKEYFLKYLKPNFTVWDFEIKNMPESKKDEATVISTSGWIENNVFKSSNVYKKGVPFPRWEQQFPWGCSSGMKKEDILLIYDHILKDNKNKKDLLHKIENFLKDDKLYH